MGKYPNCLKYKTIFSLRNRMQKKSHDKIAITFISRLQKNTLNYKTLNSILPSIVVVLIYFAFLWYLLYVITISACMCISKCMHGYSELAYKIKMTDSCTLHTNLISIREYACMWSWFRRINGRRSTRFDSTPSSSSFARNVSLILSQQNGLHLTINLAVGIAQRIFAQTQSTRCVICANQWI